MAIGTRVFLVILFLSAATAALADPKSEALKVFFSQKLLQNLINMPVENDRTISQTVLGTVIKGTAITRGTLRLELIPAANNAILGLRIEADTTSHTIGRNVPRKDITVNIYSTAKTHLDTTKPIIIYPNRIETREAYCEARTELTYEGIDVTATGLFKNAKERIAHQQAVAKLTQTKNDQEQKVSQQAKDEMQKLLDERLTPDLFRPLNVTFGRDFYRPLFLSGRVPGELHFSTVPANLSLRVDANQELSQESLDNRPDFTSGATMGMRLHESLPTSMMAKRLVDRTMNEEDLEEFFILHGLSGRLAHYKPSEAQAKVTFGKNPIALRFRDSNVEITLSADKLFFAGRETADFRAVATYSISATTEGEVKMARTAVEVMPNDSELKSRFERIFSESESLPHFIVPEALNVPGELRANRAAARNGWLVVEWQLSKKVGQR